MKKLLLVEVPDGFDLITKSIIVWKKDKMIPISPDDIMQIGQKKITLPTEDEIYKEAEKQHPLPKSYRNVYIEGLQEGYVDGQKDLINKILNQ